MISDNSIQLIGLSFSLSVHLCVYLIICLFSRFLLLFLACAYLHFFPILIPQRWHSFCRSQLCHLSEYILSQSGHESDRKYNLVLLVDQYIFGSYLLCFFSLYVSCNFWWGGFCVVLHLNILHFFVLVLRFSTIVGSLIVLFFCHLV